MIYLDNHASTRCDPRVVDAMLPYFAEHFGNPHSGSHSFGRDAASGVEAASHDLAKLLNVPIESIVFTSGATGVITWPSEACVCTHVKNVDTS